MAGKQDIREKLAKLEALFARGATAGERAAAGAARDRLQARLSLDANDGGDPEIELQYSLPDVWSVRIFVALCRKHGISDATFYKWRSKYRCLEVSGAKRLKQLEDENGKLKRLVAELTLDKTMLQDALRKKW